MAAELLFRDESLSAQSTKAAVRIFNSGTRVRNMITDRWTSRARGWATGCPSRSPGAGWGPCSTRRWRSSSRRIPSGASTTTARATSRATGTRAGRSRCFPTWWATPSSMACPARR
ncbi:hypothetical protein [Azohydromonas aeria]|uniref:hypothetical protein n=1 Tax=Azohydromonas aeria TaxID=2590212 RepID=UPI0035BF1132